MIKERTGRGSKWWEKQDWDGRLIQNNLLIRQGSWANSQKTSLRQRPDTPDWQHCPSLSLSPPPRQKQLTPTPDLVEITATRPGKISNQLKKQKDVCLRVAGRNWAEDALSWFPAASPNLGPHSPSRRGAERRAAVKKSVHVFWLHWKMLSVQKGRP